MSVEELKVAHQSQEKFQFYAVALVFTILGLSVQTASFDGHIAARICELLAWLFLLISGLSGLSHLEWNPVIRIQMIRKDDLESKAHHLEAEKERGKQQVHVLQTNSVVPIDERLSEYQSYLSKLEGQITTLDKKAGFKYFLFKYCFAIGIALLLAARSAGPLVAIARELGVGT